MATRKATTKETTKETTKAAAAEATTGATKATRKPSRKQAIKNALSTFEAKLMSEETCDITLAEYVKLLQISQELAESTPKEVTVSWVDGPKSDEA
jgi:hypothetical protein